MAEEIIQEEVLPVEEVSFEQPKPKTYLQKVHANLVDLYGKDQVPDEVTFSAKIKDPKYVKIVHDNLVHEYGQSEVPDIKSFTDSLIIVGPEKKNRGLDESKVSGVQSNPTELPLLSTKNNVQKVVTQTTDTFDKNANPTSLARQAYSLKQPKPVAKENVATDMMGMPVESSVDLYNENDINTSKNIDKHLEKLGYKKDFIDVVNRIPESYREATGYTDQELADLYKNDKNEFNKRTSEVLFREGLASGMNDIKSSIMKNTSLTPEEKDLQLGKIQNEEFLQNQEAMSTGGGFKNKQYFIGQTAKRIKQFIADPEKQKKALEDLATYAADDFGSLEDLEDKNKSPLSPNLNDYQSVALNYLEQIDPDKAAFYKKYVDIDKSKLKEFEYKGYQQILKELDEIGLNLVVNNAQNQIKPLADLAKQQEGKLDPSDYEVYNKLLETANLASTRLAKINQVYPDAKNLDTETIAGDLVGPRYSELEVLGNKLLYGLGKTGKGIYDIAATPFRTQQENDNAALEALGIENYVAPKTTPSSKNSLLARGEAKLSPELERQRQSIIKDKSLSQDEKVDKMIDLLERNPDKWTRPSEETSWNVGVNSITSSLLNFTADIAPFIALETLTAGGATSASASGVIKSFGKMFANVAVTSYSDELARQLKENNPNPELSAYSNILVNTIAYKLAGVGDIVKGIRGGAKELGGLTEKVISKLDDKAILDALKKPNPTLKSFFSDLGKTVVQSAGKGLKSGAAFETVIGSKEALMGEKVDSEFIKNRLVGLLNFTLFNVATRAPLGMPKIDKQSKEALFLAATNRDQVLYEAEKSFANKQISESEYNQIKNNVDAAYKVLERVPMVNGKGEELSRKEATELMYLKIQEQFIEDKMKKDLPEEVQKKITKELADVQDKIDKVYKGTFIEDAGKPFAGLEDREAKRKIKTEEPTVLSETKPTKVEVSEEVKTVEQLRAEEQAELDSRIPNAEQYRVDGKVDRAKLTNEEDIKAFDEVYNKYDNLISPLLEKKQTSPTEVKIGDSVQWTSQGTDQFAEPRKIKSISEDGKYAFVEGSDTGIPIDELSVTEIKPVKVKEKVVITAPKIELPTVEEPKPTKTPEEVAISKKALGDNYNFSKEFDARGGDVVATDVLEQVTKKAEKNNTDVKTQRAIDVDNMYKTDPEPTEYNIITAGSHLLEIDTKIAKAQEAGNTTEVENLTEQRNRTLSVLRKLGNKAGRNLGLFNLAFMMEAEGDRSEVKVTRNNLKKILKVDDLPDTLAELNKSDLTAEQKKLVIPYIKKLEKIKTDYDPVEKQVYENISEINNEQLNAEIEKARAEGKKEGFEEAMKSASTEVKQKKSKKIKDLAAQIRRSDEFDKFLQGSGPLGDVKKAGVVDLGSYKEIVANVLEAVAKAVELGENVTEAIKKASQKFADVDQGKLISDVRTIMSRAALPSKKEAMDKISEIAKAQGVTGITKEMSDQGLIKDVVNSYLGTDLTNDKILEAATNDLKSILPSVTKENLSNAYVERGEFKKETKAKIENKIDEKKADVKRLAIKEARLEALEAADDYHLEETKEGKKRIKSDYEKELDDKINALLKEKKGLQKEEKVSKAPKTEQDKIDEINREIEYVKATKSVYEQAIKNPKKASEALIAARKEREETYAAYGLKLEKNAKSPILVERDYQDAVKEIENSDLSDAEKNSKIEELTAQRDLDLQGTKQGVVSLLSDDVSNYVKSNLENADLNNNLKSILSGLEPTGEKLDDQINKAYTKLTKLLDDKSLSKEEIKSISNIISNLERNNQLSSDQLSAQRLKNQWENEIRKAETDIASGNFTKIPNNTYDYRRNDQLVILNKARENKTGQYNRLVADAREKNRTLGEKALDLSTKFLVSGVHTALKVAEAGSFKPFMDSLVDLTGGKVASYFTGAPSTSLYSVKKGFKTFAAFKNKEAAQKYIQKLQNDRDAALVRLQEANESGNQSDIKKADKEFKKADLEYAISTLYNSIETNVLNSFWQYMKHGATDYDVNIGKSSKKDISDYRTILGKTGYVLDGWIRMHGAMKSSLSARPEMMKVFSSTLKDFQNKGKELSPENISLAMVLAADAYEAGRLTNKTALSKMISRGKGSEKYPEIRYLTKAIMPVSTIAVNLAKRGIDYSAGAIFPGGVEGWVRLANETKKGMKLNEVEGRTYDGIISRIKDGWNQIPLKERVYINGVIGRGLFGSAMMVLAAYGLQNGMIKYGGTFEDQKKRKIMGTDGEQLKAGEWEFFGERMPKAASLFLNHLPEFLALSLVTDNYQINQMGGTGEDKFETTIDEIQARFPFQTIAGAFVPGRRTTTLIDRFTRIPIAAEAATLLDEKAEFRDKSDFINRIRGNVGLGFLNATKEQQKQIDEIKKSLRGLPEGVLTPEDEKDIDSVIREIKNIDFGELETKKAMEEMQKELKKQ
jgi:hypothetical protein